MASVVVVGGGLAGLSAAWRLQQAGHDVEVLEAEPVAGGRMRSETHGGFALDRGAQFISSAYPNIHRLIDVLGLSDRVQPFRHSRNAILRDGKLHPADTDSPLRVVRSGLLSATAKVRLSRLLLEAWRQRGKIDPWQPERAAEIDDEDLESWCRTSIGDEAFDYLVAPGFCSTFDSDPEHLSLVFALQAMRLTQEDFRLQSLSGGVGLLTETLAASLDVRTGCTVTAVETESGGVRVGFRSAGVEQAVLADAAVMALPGTRVAEVYPGLTAEERNFFGEVHYVRGMIAFLLFDEAPETLPWYGVAFPQPEGLDLYGLAVDHWKEGQAPPGAGLVNCALTAGTAERLWDADDETVIACVLENLARTPIGALEPASTVVHRWDPMLPQFRAGYTRHLASFLRRADRSPRLAFAGDYLVGPYTEGACTSGLRAADELAAELK